MALISEIRKRSWLLLVLIGLGMLAFLLMDVKGPGGGGRPDATVGYINGTKIDRMDIDTRLRVQNNQSVSEAERVSGIWEQLVQEKLYEQEADALGIGMPANYVNRVKNGEFKNALWDYFQQAPQEQKAGLAGQIDSYIASQYISDRVNAIYGKGLYTPNWMVGKEFALQNSTYTFDYVFIPFVNMDNVSANDEELKSYLKAHADDFKSEASTDIEYITFDVTASAIDSSIIKGEMTELLPAFAETKKDSSFVADNYGEPFNEAYLKKDQLGNNILADSFFVNTIGRTYGPYVEGNRYKIAKLVDRQMIPDSVKYRQIVRRVADLQNQEAIRDEFLRSDSLVKALNNGEAIFDSLVVNDPTKGIVDYIGYNISSPRADKRMMDLLFFKGEKQKYYLHPGIDGYYIIEILDRKDYTNEGVKVAYISAPIIPSKETQDDVYAKALSFVNNNRTAEAFSKSALDQALNKVKANGLEVNSFEVNGLDRSDEARKMIKWANSAEVGDVYKQVFSFENTLENYTNKYVVAIVTGKTDEGTPKLESVKSRLEIKVVNQKKAKATAAALKGKDLEAAASQYEVEVVNIADGRMSDLRPPLGQEVAVRSALVGLGQGQVSAPIEGDNGVYLIKMNSKVDAVNPPDLGTARSLVFGKVRQQLNQLVIDALKEKASITDNRFTYY